MNSQTPPADEAAPLPASDAPGLDLVPSVAANAAAPLETQGADAATALPSAPSLGAAVQACGQGLAERFPALFGPGVVLPLQLRIQTEIQARAPGVFTRRVLSAFLSRHTTTNAYLKALVASPSRFDLEGQAAGELSEEHREAARQELARRQQIHRERMRAAQAQRSPGEARARQPARGEPAPGPKGPRPPRPERRRPRPQPPTNHRPDHAAGRGEASSQSTLRQEARLEDAGATERAALLRAFESSPLSKANFCALRRITEASLDAALDQARQEQKARQSAQPRPPSTGGGVPGRR